MLFLLGFSGCFNRINFTWMSLVVSWDVNVIHFDSIRVKWNVSGTTSSIHENCHRKIIYKWWLVGIVKWHKIINRDCKMQNRKIHGISEQGGAPSRTSWFIIPFNYRYFSQTNPTMWCPQLYLLVYKRQLVRYKDHKQYWNWIYVHQLRYHKSAVNPF